MQDVEEGQNDQDSPMFRCPHGTKYISEEADILKNAEFETGVCKIQNGMAEVMMAHEKVACEKLLLETDGDLSDTSEEEVTYEERLRRRRRKRENPSGYVTCDFILGSAAEVERLWSIATF